MRQSLLAWGVFLCAMATHAQSGPATAGGIDAVPRTPWGTPDLQGVWNIASGTPLERPAIYAGREFLTDDELRQAEEEADEQRDGHEDQPGEADPERPPRPGVGALGLHASILPARCSGIAGPQRRCRNLSVSHTGSRSLHTLFCNDVINLL